MVHIYNGTLLSHKTEGIWGSPSEVNEPRDYYTEWNKWEKEKNQYRILMHIYEI